MPFEFVRRNASQSDQTARGFLLTVADGQCRPTCGCHCAVAMWTIGWAKTMFRRTSHVFTQVFFNKVWLCCGAPFLSHAAPQPAKAKYISTRPVFRPFGFCTCHLSLLYWPRSPNCIWQPMGPCKSPPHSPNTHFPGSALQRRNLRPQIVTYRL